jgi:predicted KAP-like P-loop ATPase
LHLYAGQIPDGSVQPLLSAIFELGDELNVASDEARGFSLGNNYLRIHWLLRRLTLERWDLAHRSAVLMAASTTATLGWFVTFADSAYRDYHPQERNQREPECNCLVTSEHADKLRTQALERIRAASRSGELAAQGERELPNILYRWREFAGDDGVEVKHWTDEQLGNDRMVVIFAEAFTSYIWSQGMGVAGLGDMVAKRSTRASVSSLHTIMDRERFRSRLEDLAASHNLSDADAKLVNEFLEAWKRDDANRNN